jgi:hypothetical protein
VLVVAEDLVGRPGVPNRQARAVKGDLVQLVSEATPRLLAAEPGKSIAQGASHRLCLGLPCEFRQRLGEPLGLWIPDIESHYPYV